MMKAIAMTMRRERRPSIDHTLSPRRTILSFYA